MKRRNHYSGCSSVRATDARSFGTIRMEWMELSDEPILSQLDNLLWNVFKFKTSKEVIQHLIFTRALVFSGNIDPHPEFLSNMQWAGWLHNPPPRPIPWTKSPGAATLAQTASLSGRGVVCINSLRIWVSISNSPANFKCNRSWSCEESMKMLLN